jgi:tRNA C32,U32 (ribose-2'-O)-methylase TrmJ
MTKFPIAVRIRFTKLIPSEVSNEMIEESSEKSDEMYFLNKMELYVNHVDEYTTERYFSNQEAAEEWVTFIKDATSRNDLGIEDIKIFEI